MNISRTNPLKICGLLVFSFTFIALVSFNNKKATNLVNKSAKKSTSPVKTNLETLGIFDMDYATFQALGGSWDRRLIIQFKTIYSSLGTKYEIAAYMATSQLDHGENATVIPLVSKTDGGLQLTKGKNYFIGNNYIRLRTIKKYLKAIQDENQNVDIKSLRFTAVSWTDEDPDHVFFLIQAFDGSSKLIKASSFSEKDVDDGGVFSNPSPPADPSTN